MSDRSSRVCPVEKADSLDTKFRRLLQNPQRILKPYIKKGMTVLDIGCGPGFFSIEMALMVGESGRVIASDLQEGMLQKIRDKIEGTEIEHRIVLHKCEKDKIGLSEKADFVLAFYVVHEIPDKEKFFAEIATILKPGGLFFIIEPPFHVSKTAFEETIGKALSAGLEESGRPGVFLSKTVLLKKL